MTEHTGTEHAGSGRGRRATRLSAVLFVPLLALGACGENRSEAQKQDMARSTKLVLPSSLTPPVHVGAISGAPAAWKLSGKVATALRQRDIPASNGVRRDSNYRLTGRLARTGTGGQQLVFRWTLLDPAGKKVGEVTQMAALPAGQKPNEDILESIADAAAESLSPIIPSSKLQTARRFDTGEPTSRPPKEVDDKNRVTAVGRIKTDSPLSRNLLARPKAAGKSAAAAKGAASVTAIGRMKPGSSVLSRNLIRDGGSGSDKVNTQSTTSSRPRKATAGDTHAPRGTMTELFGRYPTSVERKAMHDGAGGAKIRRVAENDRDGVARDYAPRIHHQLAEADKKSATSRDSRRVARYRWWVQIGAYGSHAEGEGNWSSLQTRATSLLYGKNHRVVRKDLGKKGVWFRLQVGPAGSKADALSLCGRLKSAGIGCFLVAERYLGTPPPGAARPKTVARPPARSAPPRVNRGETTSNFKAKPAKKPETAPTARRADPPAKDGNGMSVYDWKKSPDKKGDGKEPPLSTRPGLPGLTK